MSSVVEGPFATETEAILKCAALNSKENPFTFGTPGVTLRDHFVVSGGTGFFVIGEAVKVKAPNKLPYYCRWPDCCAQFENRVQAIAHESASHKGVKF